MQPRSLTRGTALLAAALLWAVSTADAQIGKPEGLYYKSWAIVIGIDDYLVAPKLSWAVGDAKRLVEALRKLGFDEVVELYNKDASFKRMQMIFNDFLTRKVGRMDRVVIFFAGHAGTTTDMHGKDLGYLVPWDAQVANASKAITFDQLKESSRRVMAKHVLYLVDASVSGWDITPPQQLSLEGRLSPEEETEKRAVQVLTAAAKSEPVASKDGQTPFMRSLLAGIGGAADGDQNGWLMASELADYVKKEIERQTDGKQHPQFAQLDGDGDTVLIEGKKANFKVRRGLTTEAERTAAAKEEYDQAFAILQQQKPPQEALDHLNKALEYSPSYGDAYVLKSYLHLEFLPNLSEALAAAQSAVKFAPDNPDSAYTLGLILQRTGKFAEAEQAFRRSLAANPNYTDVYLSLGDLYAKDLKDRKRAVEAYQRYLETGGNENRVRDYMREAGATAPAEKQ